MKKAPKGAFFIPMMVFARLLQVGKHQIFWSVCWSFFCCRFFVASYVLLAVQLVVYALHLLAHSIHCFVQLSIRTKVKLGYVSLGTFGH
jgi:hypothetical protein